MSRLILHADFDGTLFDPGIKIFLSPAYNQLSMRLMRRTHALLVLNTGRPVWDRFSDVQLAAVGIPKPYAVALGCGTEILWKKGRKYEKDLEWDAHIRSTGWNKQKVKEVLTPLLTKAGIVLFETANPYMTRVWVYHQPVTKLMEFKDMCEKLLPDTQLLLTEQILMPNTTKIFSGYLLVVPRIAGKDKAALYINKKIEKDLGETFERIYVGDALVDVPFLTADTSAHAQAYGLHPTALAKEALMNTKVHVLNGSPPHLIYQILNKHLNYSSTNFQNSPYRKLTTPFTTLLDRIVDHTLTPNQISYLGLTEVKKAVQTSHIGGLSHLVKGFLMDVVDGVRARRYPHLATPDGQLIDVYTDRMKEVLQLTARGSYNAALSSFLPSIARAQAEAVGVTVPEHDGAGGSSLSRSLKLIRAYLFTRVGLVTPAKRLDEKIYEANLSTFETRRALASSFSWNKLKSYDKKSIERLLLLVSLLQLINKQIAPREKLPVDLKKALDEYLKLRTTNLYRLSQLSRPSHVLQTELMQSLKTSL